MALVLIDPTEGRRFLLERNGIRHPQTGKLELACDNDLGGAAPTSRLCSLAG